MEELLPPAPFRLHLPLPWMYPQPWARVVVEMPRDLLPLVVEKGSVALDGISLTVNELVGEDAISLMLIPETLRATTWGRKRAGDRVNVEADILAKHVARLVQTQRSRT